MLQHNLGTIWGRSLLSSHSRMHSKVPTSRANRKAAITPKIRVCTLPFTPCVCELWPAIYLTLWVSNYNAKTIAIARRHVVTEQLILKVPGGGGSEEPIQEKLRVYLKSSARSVNIQTITVRIKNIKKFLKEVKERSQNPQVEMTLFVL